MAAKKSMRKQEEAFDADEMLRTAICVPAIKQAVQNWRSADYPGITATTGELLNFWFNTDHILQSGESFKYHTAQKEAIETLIYLFEIEKVANQKELLTKYAYHVPGLRIPAYDDFARYGIKMATGSGKTKVMAMAIVWQFANAIREDD